MTILKEDGMTCLEKYCNTSVVTLDNKINSFLCKLHRDRYMRGETIETPSGNIFKPLSSAIANPSIQEAVKMAVIPNEILTNRSNELVSISQEAGSILLEAQSIIYGKRNKEYGHPIDNFELICKLLEPIIGIKITPMQYALCMVQVKIARQLHKPSRDNLVDIAGYAGTIERLSEKRSSETQRVERVNSDKSHLAKCSQRIPDQQINNPTGDTRSYDKQRAT